MKLELSRNVLPSLRSASRGRGGWANDADPQWMVATEPLLCASQVEVKTDEITRFLRQLTRDCRLYDPLREFCDSIECRSPARFGETVNFTPLITAAGCLAHWTTSHVRLRDAWHTRRQNLRHVIGAISAFAPSAIHPSLTSGAALLRANQCYAPRPVGSLRHHLARRSIVASEHLIGFVRLAMPDIPLTRGLVKKISKSLANPDEHQQSGNQVRLATQTAAVKI